MTTVLRIFIKPAGQVYVDFPVPEGGNVNTVFGSWKHDGALFNPTGIVPLDSCLYAVTYELPVGASFEKPSGLTVVPGPWGGAPEKPA